MRLGYNISPIRASIFLNLFFNLFFINIKYMAKLDVIKFYLVSLNFEAGIVLSLFLISGDFVFKLRSSYKIVLMKKECIGHSDVLTKPNIPVTSRITHTTSDYLAVSL